MLSNTYVDESLTAYGVSAIGLFFAFLALGLYGAYYTQVFIQQSNGTGPVPYGTTIFELFLHDSFQKRVGRIGGLPCFQNYEDLEGFSNPVVFTKA